MLSPGHNASRAADIGHTKRLTIMPADNNLFIMTGSHTRIFWLQGKYSVEMLAMNFAPKLIIFYLSDKRIILILQFKEK